MEQKASLLKSSFIYGLYLALISILMSVVIWVGGIMESMGIWGSAVIGIISLIITFVFLLIFSKSFRNREMGGFISYSKAFQFALLVVIISTLISSIYTYFFHTLIAPDYMENFMALMQQKVMLYLEKVGAPESQIDKAMERFSEIPTVWKTVRQGLVVGIIAGTIISLITAAIVKKKDEEEIPEA